VGLGGHVAARTEHLLDSDERNVLIGLGVKYRARQPEVDQVWHAAFLPQPHHYVVWLQVSVDVVLTVYEFNAIK